MPLALTNKNPLGGMLREPTESELMFFRGSPHVGGMATEDNKVIVNPYSSLNDDEKRGIITNEISRVIMRNGYRPKFELTEKQKKAFKSYGSEQDQRETIVGRILSGDPSALDITKEQSAFAETIRRIMGGKK